MERRRIKFKVPYGLKSIKEEHKANVAFKNLTDELIDLYWINHEGQAIYHGELKPVDRSDKGFPVCTYVTHPWVAIYGKKQALMNGRKYFFPPGNHKWNDKPLGWVSKRWNFLTQEDVHSDEAYFEVLILEPGCKTLKELCLLKACEMYSNDDMGKIKIPSVLKTDMKEVKKKYFLGCRETGRESPVF